MRIDRRSMLGFVGAAAAFPAVAGAQGTTTITARNFASDSVFSDGATPAFRAAVQHIMEQVGAPEVFAWGFPGMALAVRAADGQTATVTLGDSQPGQLYQIGSISKSLASIALLRLADQRRIDLDAPVRKAMPDLPVADPAVTFAHILSHTAGFPGNAPPFARVPGDRLWSATPPGSRFSYSNSGYDMLGLVIERASGMPFDRALASLVLAPLGMAGAVPTIRTRDRARYAKGYVAFRGDLGWMPGDPLAEGPWLDFDRASGSVAATSADMLRYIAFIGACARGEGGGVLSAASARRLTTAVIEAPEFGPGARYGFGLATVPLPGGPALHHTGGMITFSSSVTVDPVSGAGVFASVNACGAEYRPRGTTWFGVEVLRALAAGRPLPVAAPVRPVPPIADAADYAGHFLGPGGAALAVRADGDRLSLIADGSSGGLRPVGEGKFAGNHPVLGNRALEYEGKGRRERLWVGGDLFGRDAPPAQPPVPPRLAALAGHYQSNDPWVGDTSIFARGEALMVEGAGEIREAPDGSWRFADPELVTERGWFEALAGGRAHRLNQSGEPLNRAVA